MARGINKVILVGNLGADPETRFSAGGSAVTKIRVATSDGAAFGPPGEGFVRVNFATPRAILAEALERMAKALRAPR